MALSRGAFLLIGSERNVGNLVFWGQDGYESDYSDTMPDTSEENQEAILLSQGFGATALSTEIHAEAE